MNFKEFEAARGPDPMQFQPGESERQKITAFIDKHDREAHGKTDEEPRYSGAIGGAWTWSFTPTGLGHAVTITCSCGASLNATDYESW